MDIRYVKFFIIAYYYIQPSPPAIQAITKYTTTAGQYSVYVRVLNVVHACTSFGSDLNCN